ncbi:Glycosyl transferase, family 2 [Bradyrhizobium sp. STM 3843]|uniref:glycosyltransferase family 2 protein n=1 Tax=Bradyrhizobium sp. STM 3843 TaxID=551947 RepID=UPI000240533B|nr:glycosyltransferase family 2 protein [Bradyrhizobium sp. STM 3843]CCE09375.1 Glycosyl transferase, family 2 [Bradyrhizobium sp. STM 3843]
MTAFVSLLSIAVAVLLAPLVAVFAAEIIAAVILSRRKHPVPAAPSGIQRPPLAVLIPAHNESSGIRPTIADIRAQLLPHDRLLVVADNCSDDTAAMARDAGAEVIERTDLVRRGKGYALDWGVRHLGSRPPAVVIIVDADCRVSEGAIEALASACGSSNRPVQALYLMSAPVNSSINHQVAEFSWRVKNWLRPLGLFVLDLPCQLMGSGMAFPWEVIRTAELASGQIVEDLTLGLDLTLAGHPPLFCPTARIGSTFPTSAKGAQSQRRRWEHGHLDTIMRAAPKLLARACVKRDLDLMAVALDLSVPPVSLLGMLVLAAFGLSLLASLIGGSSIGLWVSAGNLLVFVSAIGIAWLKCGMDLVPPASLLLIPFYVARKLKLYAQFAFGQVDSQWTRTDRAKDGLKIDEKQSVKGPMS